MGETFTDQAFPLPAHPAGMLGTALGCLLVVSVLQGGCRREVPCWDAAVGRCVEQRDERVK